MLDHFASVLGGRVHGGAACTLFTGNTFTQSAIHNPGQVFRDNGIKHGGAVWLIEHQTLMLVARLRRFGIKRKNRQNDCSLGQHGNKLGKGNANFIKSAFQKLLAHKAGNFKAVADRNIPCDGKRIRQNPDLVALKVFHCLFADGQHTIFPPFSIRFHGF